MIAFSISRLHPLQMDKKAWDEWVNLSSRIVDGRKADTREGRREALDLTLGEASLKFEKMRGYIDKLTEINLSNGG